MVHKEDVRTICGIQQVLEAILAGINDVPEI